MRRRPTLAPKSGVLETGQTRLAGDAGSVDAVLVVDGITPSHAALSLKAGIVTVLAWLFELHQSTAMALGKLVTRVWGGFRGV
jgi:hypothetical protein